MILKKQLKAVLRNSKEKKTPNQNEHQKKVKPKTQSQYIWGHQRPNEFQRLEWMVVK